MADYPLLPPDFVKLTRLLLTPKGVVVSVLPENVAQLQLLFRRYGVWFPWQQCSADTWLNIRQQYYGEHSNHFSTQVHNEALDELVQTLAEPDTRFLQDDDAPVIRFIDEMIAEALSRNASDIHVESYPYGLVIRFRVDGFLQEVSRSDSRLAAPLVSRLKIMAALDIAERRLPQDGRILFHHPEKEVDIRISFIPVAEGERVVLRLLARTQFSSTLDAIGMAPGLCNQVRPLLAQPHGMILITGPTGSGKSTSLYTFLQEIYAPEKNILTIEDPVEYQIAGIGQTQVNTKAGMTFSRGLRALLRQDPDVVMIGEIRDAETAGIAVQASLTGHMVLSTLHTNTAVGAVSRLRDMGVESYLLASVLSGVLSQRLVRVLCPHCRQPAEASLPVGRQPERHYTPKGCGACNWSGYKGRTGIHELMVVDDSVRALIHAGGSDADIGKASGMAERSLFMDGLAKVNAGITSLDELLRVTVQVAREEPF